MKDFLRPGLWDIIGVVLGVAGLVAGGTIVVRLAPSGELLLALAFSSFFIAIGGFSFRVYLYNRRFPFSGVEHRVKLQFKADGAPGHQFVKAHLRRETSFSPRLQNVTKFDRYQLIPDATALDASQALQGMQHSYEVEAKKGSGLSASWFPLRSVKFEPFIVDMRQLRLVFNFENDMRHTSSRYRIIEELDLPNDFSQPREFYVFEVSEPARVRHFEFHFMDIDVRSARYYMRQGTNTGKPVEIDIQQLSPPQGKCRFEAKVKNAVVGSKIYFEWEWDGI